LVGQSLVRTLARIPRVERICVLVRRPWPERTPKVEALLADFERLEEAGLPALTAVFCALGSTIRKAGSRTAFHRIDHDYPLNVARIAAKQGARQFSLVSSVGAASSSPNFYLRVKGGLEQDLASLPFDALHLFRPGFLLGERQERRTGERVGIAVFRTVEFLLAGPLRKYRAVEAETLARAMAAAALAADARMPEALGTRIYHYDQIREWSAGLDARAAVPPATS
jgi:uncharacterized protein YbjT (DUF2867 family)